MSEREVILDWDVLLDDTEWNRTESLGDLLVAEAAPQTSPPLSSSRLPWAMGVACLLVVVGAGLLLRHYATVGLSRINAEVQEIVETEAWVQQTGKSLVAASLVDGQADRRWQERFRRDLNHSGFFSGAQMAQGEVEIQTVTLRSDLAMVAVIVQGPDGTRHRQMRFYRQDEKDGWLRTAPSPVFWGSKQTVETVYFRIHYRQRDEYAVLDAAARLDKIYTNLRQDAGLPPASGKLTVEVRPLSPYQLDYLQFEENRLEVHSPLLLQVPEGLSDEETLTKSIVNPLVAYVLAEAQQQVAVRWRWLPMLRGLRLWQVYVGSDSYPLWYQDAVALLYEDAQDVRSVQRTVTLHDLSRLCRTYAIWRYNMPGDLAQRLCADENWTPRLLRVAQGPDRLDAFVLLGESDHVRSNRSWTDEWVRRVAAATVIDYLVATYGRDRLPALMAGFCTYDSWDTLAPAVLGVSAQELERDWLAYVVVANELGGKVE
jgi:hypothetical protein